MTAAKHTPGKWEHGINGDMTRVGAWCTAGRQTVAYCRIAKDGGCNQDVEVAEANARLIAATPELLKELQAARSFIQSALDEEAERTDHMSVHTLDLARRIDLAIAKATGSAS